MEERMTVCNMSIEGGARVGYVESRRDHLRLPQGPAVFAHGCGLGRRRRELEVLRFRSGLPTMTTLSTIDAADIAPTVTWGINPGQGISIVENIPSPDTAISDDDKAGIIEALAYMKLPAGQPIKGTKINVAFLGSCTNGRLIGLPRGREIHQGSQGRRGRAAPSPCPARRSWPLQCEG